jgi:hypothetical protein
MIDLQNLQSKYKNKVKIEEARQYARGSSKYIDC